MTITGFPDFQDLPAWRGAPIVSGSVIVVPVAGATFGPQAVSNYAALEVHLFGGTAGLTLTVTFTADLAQTLVLNTVTWTLPSGFRLDALIPTSGDFAAVTLAPTGGAQVTCSGYIVPANESVGAYRCLTANPELLQDLTAVAAGATSRPPMPALVGGPAWVLVSPADAAAMLHFEVETVNGAGNSLHFVHDLGTPAAATGVMIALPWAPCGLKVINNDGANPHSFRAAIIPRLAA